MACRIAIPGHDLEDAVALALLWYTDAWQQVQTASPLPWLWICAMEPYWTWEGNARGPILLEIGRVLERESKGRNRLRAATIPVLLDSGAFSMIAKHGCWIRTPEEHVAEARRICGELGTVQYVATQDWMCEPAMLQRTGLTVAEHQRRTIESYLRLRDLAPELPLLPALQGYTIGDYLDCAEGYDRAGVKLAGMLVGLGSVCRRSNTAELESIITAITAALPGVDFHGYGVKSGGTLRSCLDLRSVDSEAWSRRGRGMGIELRAAGGLPAKAPWVALAEAMAARADRVDLDTLDLFRWMDEAGQRGGLQNSLAWAEIWRARQQCRIAEAAMRRSAEIALTTMPGQLRLRGVRG